MLSVFVEGGPFMFVILGISVIALAVFLERAVFLYFRMNLNMDKAYQQILYPLEKENFRAAIDGCSKIIKHPLGKILKAGLIKADRRDKEIERAMEEKMISESARLKSRVNLLTLFANIVALLGLLGTILGLISAFQSVSSASAAAKQDILARGISTAMSTTAAGLIVAIPCLAGFYILNNRSDFILDKLEEKAVAMANTLSALKQKKANDAAAR